MACLGSRKLAYILTLFCFSFTFIGVGLFCYWGIKSNRLDPIIYGTDSYGRRCGPKIDNTRTYKMALSYGRQSPSICVDACPNKTSSCEDVLATNGYNLSSTCTRQICEHFENATHYIEGERCLVSQKFKDTEKNRQSASYRVGDPFKECGFQKPTIFDKITETMAVTISLPSCYLIRVFLTGFFSTLVLGLSVCCYDPGLKFHFIISSAFLFIMINIHYASHIGSWTEFRASCCWIGCWVMGKSMDAHMIDVTIQQVRITLLTVFLFFFNWFFLCAVFINRRNLLTVCQHQIKCRDTLNRLPGLLLSLAGTYMMLFLSSSFFTLALVIVYSSWDLFEVSLLDHDFADPHLVWGVFAFIQVCNWIWSCELLMAAHQTRIARSVSREIQPDAMQDESYMATVTQLVLLRTALYPFCCLADLVRLIVRTLFGWRLGTKSALLALHRAKSDVYICIGMFGDDGFEAIERSRKIRRLSHKLSHTNNFAYPPIMRVAITIISACLARSILIIIDPPMTQGSIFFAFIDSRQFIGLLLLCYVTSAYLVDVQHTADDALLFHQIETNDGGRTENACELVEDLFITCQRKSSSMLCQARHGSWLLLHKSKQLIRNLQPKYRHLNKKFRRSEWRRSRDNRSDEIENIELVL